MMAGNFVSSPSATVKATSLAGSSRSPSAVGSATSTGPSASSFTSP